MIKGSMARSKTPRTLLLARHGETAWNSEGRWQGHTDIALSDRGREQAAALASRLRRLGHPLARIRSSDLARARETAEIVGRALGVADLGFDPRLRERGFGVFEGLTREECVAQFPDLWALYEQDKKVLPTGGEPHEAVVARLTEGMDRALFPPPESEGAILVVGHGGATRVFLTAVFGRPFPPIGNAGLLKVTVSDRNLVDVEDLGAE
jgi:broad specificity phosphatase PhoE